MKTGVGVAVCILAGVGVGVFRDVPAACEQVIRVKERTQPGPAASVYERYYPRYRALYPALAAEFAAMTRVVASA